VDATPALKRRWGKRVRNFYVCNECTAVFPRKGVSADHVHPVVDPKVGFVDFNTYITRLFCERDGFQIICDECHNAKTAKERKVRATSKARKKTHV
jgi:5-methylcytosine-specific restriction endonuclease McrA